jgi:hypothetical protein
MSNFQAVSTAAFAKKSWKYNQNYLFSATDAVCSLALTELHQAVMGMPLAFISTNDEYSVVGVQGLQQGLNSIVDANGTWRGSYIPAVYRGYPFALGRESEEGELTLCFDIDSGLLVDDDTAEPFFDDDLEPSHLVSERLEFLSNVASGLKASVQVCKRLEDHRLFKPWKLKFKLADEKVYTTDGLFCIDEAAFNKLSDDAFAELRSVGAIHLIYCQLLSMQRISDLTLFTKERLAVDLPQTTEVDLNESSTDGNISFENL